MGEVFAAAVEIINSRTRRPVMVIAVRIDDLVSAVRSSVSVPAASVRVSLNTIVAGTVDAPCSVPENPAIVWTTPSPSAARPSPSPSVSVTRRSRLYLAETDAAMPVSPGWSCAGAYVAAVGVTIADSLNFIEYTTGDSLKFTLDSVQNPVPTHVAAAA